MRTNKIHILIALLIGFSSCNYADFEGMWVVGESVNERFSQSEEFNATQPQQVLHANANAYKISVIADAHVGETANLTKFFTLSKSAGVLAAVLNGDICNGNDYDYENLQAALPDTADLKYFMLAGNHELYFGGWEHFSKAFGSSTYYFTVKSGTETDLFICLDSGSGTLGSRQLEWFKEVLNDIRPAHRHCVVFTHNNLYRIRKTASTNPVQEELQVLTDLFARHNIGMVINGHDHLRNVLEFGKTTHITMDAAFDGFEKASYLTLTIDNNGVGYEFNELAPNP